MEHSRRIMVLSIAAAVNLLAVAQGTRRIEEMKITGVRMNAPLSITTDPKTPRQPHCGRCAYGCLERGRPAHVDVGLMYRQGNFDGSIPTFVNDIRDYPMI